MTSILPRCRRIAGQRANRQRGAALLTAMVIVTLVATLASAMVWQQWRAVQVEVAERARAQALWILTGAVDWARLILREDARTGGADHLGEPWAVPLAEAQLSTFLAVDRDNTDDAPEAFLSGSITDAQSRYNLRNLVEAGSGTASAAEERVLQRLLDAVGARSDLAPMIVRGLRAATLASGQSSGAELSTDPPLMPERIEQLAWIGLDAETLALLTPYVSLLPVRTTVNANTAPKEVLAAVIEGLDLASADRLIQARQRNPFRNVAELDALLPQGVSAATERVSVTSSFFEVRGRLRLQDRSVEERALVERRNLDIVTLRRDRVASVESLGR
ncbi:MAG: type II secretion system minor pseudopilin GspK [Methylibium sp.]|uniref:Type II secretion system protein K n=1 Tax=Methylibium petroleiphilum (strain ATCC BAA-1232 / LMG 22953 / PM1) TaxID=420662 RepID=A2SKJ6_METPP|nr:MULTISPECIES: type II secretion system minor pseudopilin GspK [Methylibium]ABM96085.1 general secretion pathway protein K [Methylibium petroleiphilum PM1]EWS61796.1 Type II secretory pathway, component PulK [Methylibium sp. T29-B]